MKASDLRIGNLVFDKILEKVVLIEKIEKGHFSNKAMHFIEGNKKPLASSGEICEYQINDRNIENFEPVCITDKILLNAGFNKYSNFQYWGDTYHLNPCFWFNQKNKGSAIVGSDLSICIIDGKFYTLENICIDNDNVINDIELKGFHHLQNIVNDLTNKELPIKLLDV